MNSRAGHIGLLVFERGRRGSLRRTLLILLLLTVLILYVGGKVSIVRLGYRIDAMDREKKELERVNRSLRIEASSLSSPARLEEIAGRMGMSRPPKENIVIVRRRSDSGHQARD